jgi:hypothetical protein
MSSFKRYITISLLLFFLLSFLGCRNLIPALPDSSVQEQAGVLYFNPATPEPSSGDHLEVDLKVGAVDNLKGYSITLGYDKTLLDPKGITEGPFFSSGETFFYHDINHKEGTILIDCAILGQGKSISGEGVLATVTFSCLKPGSAVIDILRAKTRNVENKDIVTTKEEVIVKTR